MDWIKSQGDLKQCTSEIAPSLTRLINLSLRVGCVPKDWKCANIVPVFKKGNKEEVINYRPISLLSLVSKIAERCVFAHFYSFIAGNNIYPLQLALLRDAQLSPSFWTLCIG